MRDYRWRRGVIPLLVLAVSLVGAVVLWRLKVGNDLREGAYERSMVSTEMGRRAQALIAAHVRRVRGLAQRFAQGAIRSDADFRAAVTQEIDTPGAYRAVVWIRGGGGGGTITYAWSTADETELKRGLRLTEWPVWLHSLERVRLTRRPRFMYVSHAVNRSQLLFVVPAISGEGTSAAYLGSVAARVDVAGMLRGLVPHGAEANYDLEIGDGRAPLFTRGARIDEDDANADGEAIGVLDRFWKLRVRPSAAAATAASLRVGRSALWVLYVGVASAVGLSWLVASALRRRYEAAAQAERQVAAITSLTQTAGVILAEPGAGGEALNRLAACARKVLGMGRAVVTVVDPSLRTARVVASDGEGEPFRTDHRTFPLEAMAGTRDCIGRGEVVAVEDATTDQRVNRSVLAAYGLRSALFVPLTFENRSIGAMCVADRRPRTFTEGELRLARLLGAQAGVILANHRLYQDKVAALAAQKELTVRHESLYQLATEIFRGEDLEMSLQGVADAAPALLGVDVCLVSLRVGEDETRVAAITARYADCRGERNVASRSNVGHVWQTREPLVIEDASADATLHPAYRHRLRVGSVMYLPLIGGADRAIGTMVLVRHEAGAFSAEQRELAEVLAARAAVAIHTATLHEQARQSAQTQEMLLRELNHRVKNNLASIVALLGVNRPTMPGDALSWLNRATERIATMARTHDLFVGGADRIDLRDLVAKLLPALSLIKPSGVEVRTDLNGVRVGLGTDRAVSLAMVLNELCWNALEHGSGENGTLWIRGHETEDQRRLVLEVEDDGGGGGGRHDGKHNGDGAPVAGNGDGGAVAVADVAASWQRFTNGNGRGTGLRLVEGLVSRELRGHFQIRRARDGHGGGGTGAGTVARVEIPLDTGEITRVSA